MTTERAPPTVSHWRRHNHAVAEGDLPSAAASCHSGRVRQAPRKCPSGEELG